MGHIPNNQIEWYESADIRVPITDVVQGTLVQFRTHDDIGQLTSWTTNPWDSANSTVETYSYDDVGNRTTRGNTVGGIFTGSVTYEIGPTGQNPMAGQNQLLRARQHDAWATPQEYTDFAYDADGSMIERTRHDPLGTPMIEERYGYSSWRGLTTGFEREDLSGPPPPAPPLLFSWEYRYNAMGEREQKRETSNPSGSGTLPGYGWTYYLLNGTKEQLSMWEGAEAGSAGTCSWLTGQNVYLWPAEYLVYGVEYPGIREDIPRLSLRPDGTPEYRLTDHLASVRQTLDAGGTIVNRLDYEPFGAVLSSQGVERQSFNSREHDAEDEMSNNGVRKLDERLGRFVAVDPLWAVEYSMSPYQYSLNAPMVLSDPSGLVVDYSKNPKYAQADAQEVFERAMALLAGTTGGEMLCQIAESSDVKLYFVVQYGTSGSDVSSQYDPMSNTLYFNPSIGLEYVDANGDRQSISPVVVMAHEGSHAWVDLLGWDALREWAAQENIQYGSNSELHAIFVEHLTGVQRDEIPDGQSTMRQSHGGTETVVSDMETRP